MRWKGGVAVWLAGAAGMVDATGLAGVGRYSSHMTGTTTHSMVGGLGGDLSLLGFGMLAVACFFAGTIGSGVVLTHPQARRHGATLAVLIGAETTLVLGGGLCMALLPTGPWGAMAVIAGFAAAMGVQNTGSTYLLKPFQRTTHITSNMTDFGCDLGMRLRGWAGRPTGKALASPDQETMVSAGLPILGFAAGALAGVVLHLIVGQWSGMLAALPPALATVWLLAAAPVEKPA